MTEYVATMVVGPVAPEGTVGAVVKKLGGRTCILIGREDMEAHVLPGYTLDNIWCMELVAYELFDLLQEQGIELEPYKEYCLGTEDDRVHVSKGTYHSVDGPIEVYYVSL